MPVLTRACANFARAISRATTNGSAWRFTRRKSGRSTSCKPRCSSSGGSCRTGATADGRLASGDTGGTGRARRDHYRYLKSCSRR